MKPLFANIFGPPGTGKSTLGFTFPPPFHYARFDRRSDKLIAAVREKFGEGAVVEEAFIPELGEELQARSQEFLDRTLALAKKAVQVGEGTFFIDGGNRFWDIVQNVKLPSLVGLSDEARAKQEKMRRILYGDANEYLGNILLAVEDSPIHVVITHHTRGVYDAQGQETDRVKPDYFKQVPYCVGRGTKVLTAALEHVPVERLRVGDKLLAFDEERRPSRRWREATVTAREVVVLPSVRVHLEDGRVLTCSEDHPWLTKRAGGNGARWVLAKNLRASPGMRSCLAQPVEVWDEAPTKTAGYVAAAFDGEGNWHRRAALGQFTTERGPEVVGVEAIGEYPLIGITTSTGTFIAEGFASHNTATLEVFMITTAKIDVSLPSARAYALSLDGKEARVDDPPKFYGQITQCKDDTGVVGRMFPNPTFQLLYGMALSAPWPGETWQPPFIK